MLAHMKGKRRNFPEDDEEGDGKEEGGLGMTTEEENSSTSRPHAVSHDDHHHGEIPASTTAMYADHDATQLTCDVLCSLGQMSPAGLGAMAPSSATVGSSDGEASYLAMANSSSTNNTGKERGGGSKGLSSCPKSHQLPMFLSKTYHMIDKCEPSIATWSESGDNFVVKNVEKFASHVLPLYFKHSNFSSFARQLNFYGFRKLRTDPILTSDVDPRTACYVRFYHEKFQKDRPELLHQIKRATKSDQQSKDDVESLKAEVSKLKECMGQLQNETDRRLAEMSYECNRRITSMSAEYDKLAALVHQLLASGNVTASAAAAPSSSSLTPSQAQQQLQQHLPQGMQDALRNNPQAAAIAAAAAVAAGVQPAGSGGSTNSHGQAHSSSAANIVQQQAPAPPSGGMPDLMRSLSQAAALTLQQQQAEERQQQQNGTTKRSAESDGSEGVPYKRHQQE